jgi:hypothetical protein
MTMRNFINLFEAKGDPDATPGTIRLFRGDSTEIKSFETGQTNLYSLFGHGIYLTDNKRVANDYRSKGDAGQVLFRMAGVKSKKDLLARWCERTAAKMDLDGVDHSGEIAYWQSNVRYSDGGDWSVVTNDLRKLERQQRINLAAEKWKKLSRTYEVRMKLDDTGVIQKKQIGALAAFDVPEAMVARVIDAEAKIDDRVLDDLLWVLKRHKDDETARDIARYIESQSWESEDVSFREVFTSIGVDSPLRGDREVLDEYIESLQDMGYTGISYLGGISMGGGFKHRAYVFWDSAKINACRVG